MATTLANISIKDSSSWNTYLNLIYPVGSYYLANTATSPGSRFGGTWSQITGQRFLCGHSSAGTGGGNTHTLTVDQIPSHKHAIRIPIGSSSGRSALWLATQNEGTLVDPVDAGGYVQKVGGASLTTICLSTEIVICGIALRKLFTSKGGE